MQKKMNIFQGRSLAIATKHGKEEVIGPILTKDLGVYCFVPEKLDTDVLGTFSGEMERTGTPMETARLKCQLAREVTGCDLVIASEGSFGPHPHLYFVPSDEELIMLVDFKNQIEICASLLTTETNYGSGLIKSEEDLQEFARRVLFPSHALILKDREKDFSHIVKDIKEWESLYLHFDHIIQNFGNCYVETDMRAHHNPSRMKAIEQVCLKLTEKIRSICPECNTPGFGVVEQKEGLPCGFCGFPTHSLLSHVYQCQKCLYSCEKMYPNDKTEENPMYCDYCNP
jgi:hypothetical protein